MISRRTFRWIVGIQAATAIIAVVALAGVVLTLQSQVANLQTSRDRARLDNCHLLRNLVINATPSADRPRARAFVAHTELRNCDRYARSSSS